MPVVESLRNGAFDIRDELFPCGLIGYRAWAKGRVSLRVGKLFCGLAAELHQKVGHSAVSFQHRIGRCRGGRFFRGRRVSHVSVSSSHSAHGSPASQTTRLGESVSATESPLDVLANEP